MRLKTRSALALVVATLVVSPAVGQTSGDMRPLREVIGDGDQPASYIGTRCAAFFVATSEAMGDLIDAEMAQEAQGIARAFLGSAIGSMQARGMSQEDADAAAREEAGDLTAAYEARFAANRAAGDPAFSADPVFIADNADCLAALNGE
ncbi:hypothetical protein DZD18_00135 [Rhodobacteraceae bacterium W635]|uniref:hypothetical protein n=1 Tax=Nioella halotolerans TaxID=2303578 RepID=UPI000E3E6881|nr:hypothetical protein DZD18_00135 [Rhodobacteraceae bacterium W635]